MNIDTEEMKSLFSADFSKGSIIEFYNDLYSLQQSENELREGIILFFEYSVKYLRKDILLKLISEDVIIAKVFNILTPVIPKLLAEGHILKCSIPWFSTEEKNFDDIIKIVLRVNNPKSYRKRFGKFTERYGIQGLNNMFIMTSLFPNITVDSLLNLNHDLEINKDAFFLGFSVYENYTDLLSFYKVDLFFLMLTTRSSYHNFYQLLLDVNSMIHLLLETDTKKKIKKAMPKKIKSFRQLHDSLVTLVNGCSFNFSSDAKVQKLNQIIEVLEGHEILDYEITVPKTNIDLALTGRTLVSCVGSYTLAVMLKQSQILNLRIKGKLIYTVEILNITTRPYVSQIAGFANCVPVQEEYVRIRESLSELINRILI